MKWLLSFIILLPAAYANCEPLELTIREINDFSFKISFHPNVPVEYWLEDSFHQAILPKKITAEAEVDIKVQNSSFEEAWVYIKARPISKYCNTVSKRQIKLIKSFQVYHSPTKQLFALVPFFFITTILTLILSFFLPKP